MYTGRKLQRDQILYRAKYSIPEQADIHTYPTHASCARDLLVSHALVYCRDLVVALPSTNATSTLMHPTTLRIHHLEARCGLVGSSDTLPTVSRYDF